MKFAGFHRSALEQRKRLPSLDAAGSRATARR
jgi:hypothetical protein